MSKGCSPWVESQDIEAAIPAGWEISSLQQIASSFIGGGTPSTKRPEYWDGDIQWTTSKSMTEFYLLKGEKTITQKGLDESSTHLVPKDNLIFGTRVGVGKIAINKVDMAISQDLTGVVVDKRRYSPEFLAFQTMHPRIQSRFEDCTRGTTIKGIPRDDLEQIKYYIPPLPEQKKIAATLLGVQEVGRRTNAVIIMLKEMKKSMTGHIFTYGPIQLSEKNTVQLKSVDGGQVPFNWNLTTLKCLLRESLKNGYSARESPSNEGVRTLTLSAVTKNDFSLPNTKITIAKPEDVDDLWLTDGDIFIERANTKELVGIAARYSGQNGYAVYPDLLVRVRAREDEVNTKYLVEYLMLNRVRQYYQRNASGTSGSMPKIRHSIIEETPIALPPKAIQDEISRILTLIDLRIDAELAYRKSINQLFYSLLDYLMTGKLRINNVEA